jgi:dihydroorotate dehydrogenase (fumarate)
MADLRTTYMGVPLANPIVVGSSSLSKTIDSIKKLEQAGAGGLVVKSLFEEQIEMEEEEFRNRLGGLEPGFAEAVNMFPKMDPGGPKQHLYWVEQARKAVKMPIFASLNCVSRVTWGEYAKQLEATGVNGIELNFYSPALDPAVAAADIERRELSTLERVRSAVKLPIAVKLHPHYTSLMNVVTRFEGAGANAFVLFNRLLQPDVDVERLVQRSSVSLSASGESLLPLRWIALLQDRVKADLVATTGIWSGQDVAKMILVGAKAVQVVSVLYREQADHIQKMLSELSSWMDAHGFASLDSFRGKMGQKQGTDPWFFARGQYIKALAGVD